MAAHALIGLAAAAALIGHPAERRPVYSPDPPRDPFMAPNGRSNLHVDAYRQLAGEGPGFNNNYAPVTIGPDGGIYLGVLGGMVSFHDARPPGGVPPEPPALRLRSRGLRSGAVRARLTGGDVELVASVEFRLGRRRVRDSRAPFARTLRGHGRVRAVVHLRDGRTVRL